MPNLRAIGRGGAGNYVSPSTRQGPSAPDDLEAQDQDGNTTSTTNASADTVRARPLSKSEYIHTGRGGAGNWGEPPEVVSASMRQGENAATPGRVSGEDTRQAAAAAAPPINRTQTRTTTTSPPGSPGKGGEAGEGGGGGGGGAAAAKSGAMTGRGGAGNFYTNRRGSKDQEAAAEIEREKGKEREREAMQHKVRDDVEAQLEMPGKAFLGGKRAESGGGMRE